MNKKLQILKFKIFNLLLIWGKDLFGIPYQLSGR